MKMDIMVISAAAAAAVMLILFIREVKPVYAVLFSAAAGLIILLQIFPDIADILGFAGSLSESAGAGGDNMLLMYKAVGTGFIVQYTSDMCKDAELSSASSGIETAGKVYILLLCIPLIKDILTVFERTFE